MSLQTSRVSKIRKRDGRIVGFDQEKIAEAIWKAAQSVGGKDRGLAVKLSSLVIEEIHKQFSPEYIPSVEEVQDIVERILIAQGRAKTAKAYILYRQKRAEIREEKKRVLEKEEIDEVDKQFDINALRVLKARYLKKEGARLVETPKQLFIRVATHVMLPHILYAEAVYRREGPAEIHEFEGFNPEEYDDRFAVGKYSLNRYHLEGLKRAYDRMNQKGLMKVSWSRLLMMLRMGEFNRYEGTVDEFCNLMVSKRFLPNTPALANFGNTLGMGSACFVLDIEDSIESIMDTLRKTALVFKAGGGMGYNFSKLRPEGDIVRSTSGTASGPISFMRLFDMMTEVIKQGGIRRGANMGVLAINHPDIEKFIAAKKGNEALRNFNLSVLITPDFWEQYERGEPYPLVNPRNGEVVREVNPKMLFDMIVYQAWESGEPGLIFYDNVNRYNPFLESLGPIVCTNPCGEVLLYPNESCNLGSINVWAFCKVDERSDHYFDWNGLRETILIAVSLLDNMIDINSFPLKDIEDMTLSTRKIGLGVMGLGDLLYELGLKYDSDEGRRFMERLMEFINYHSKIASIELAKKRGSFPYFDRTSYLEGKLPFSGCEDKVNSRLDWDEVRRSIVEYGLRNAYTTVIAPTGSISMIAGCSGGIEPVYSLVYEKNVKIGSFYYVDPVFERAMRVEELYDEELIREVSERNGSIQEIPYIPKELKEVFVTALDISPEDHIKALAALQKWVDSSISKTNNFPVDATVDYIRESYLLAHRLGCKDITVFRDTSIKDQVLVVRSKGRKQEGVDVEPKTQRQPTTPSLSKTQPMNYNPSELVVPRAARPYQNGYLHGTRYGGSDSCPVCETQVFYIEGCITCPECGWGLCS